MNEIIEMARHDGGVDDGRVMDGHVLLSCKRPFGIFVWLALVLLLFWYFNIRVASYAN